MPPSAISGMPTSRATRRAAAIAVSCGTPTPEMTRVVQIDGRPHADLEAVGAGLGAAPARLGGGDVAGDQVDVGNAALISLHRLDDVRPEWPCARVDDQHVDARALPGARRALRDRRRCRSRRRRAGGRRVALQAFGKLRRLVDVLHGDEARQRSVASSTIEQLLDAVLVQDLLARRSRLMPGRAVTRLPPWSSPPTPCGRAVSRSAGRGW